MSGTVQCFHGKANQNGKSHGKSVGFIMLQRGASQFLLWPSGCSGWAIHIPESAPEELRAIGENFRDWGKDQKTTADETESKNQSKHTHADEKVTYF
jgi:hypothetical protein